MRTFHRLRIALRASVALVLSAGPLPAVAQTYEFTVKAGKHDRRHTPVRLLLAESQVQANARPVLLERAQAAVVSDSSGRQWAAQLTRPQLLEKTAHRAGMVVRELHFVLPALKAGESVRLKAALSPEPPPSGGFAWKDEPGQFAELRFAGKPVLRYVCQPLDESNKDAREKTNTVYHHLYDPAGTRLVTKGPGGLYSHHRGLFFGFSRVTYGENQRADTWGCGGQAHESHEGFLAREAGPVLGRHAVKIAWHGQGKTVFAKEQRELSVYRVPGGQLVEFASRLATSGGKVKLDGDPQHAGFHFRAPQEVADADQKLTWYLRPDGKGRPGDTRNWDAKGRDPRCVNLPWNAMSFVLGGKRYTALYLDHPANPKEARYSERFYGRFGSYFEYELDDGKDLEIRYRLWLQEGEMTVAEAAAQSAAFVGPAEVVME